jgi:hypothetical protein
VVDGMSLKKIALMVTLGLAGCADSYKVVQFPQREADLYPVSQTREGISVAIDEVTSPDRADRYFGLDLTHRGVLPVAVIISNNGPHRVQLKPSDVLLHRGTQVIDPLPIESVIGLAKSQRRLGSSSGKEVDKYFEELGFKETVLSSGETYQGVMFFPIPPRERSSSNSYFAIMPLFHDERMQVVIGAWDLDSHDRMHFGPFSVTLPRKQEDD